MVIQPEILPSSSSDGDDAVDALQVFPRWLVAVVVLVVASLFIFLLKAIFSTILIALGLLGIWRLATKKINE